MRRAIALIAWLLIVSACGASPPPRREPPSRPSAKLVIVLIYDQLGSWALEAHLPLLSPDGAIRRTLKRGAQVERVRYSHLNTLGAPGHAVIATGSPPAWSGIAADRLWDRERRASVSVMDDGEHPVFGHAGAFAGAGRLSGGTAGEALERRTDGRAITVSIGMNDQSAILSGGHALDLCLWFDAEAGFTSSTYFTSELPAWVTEWNGQHPWQSYLEPPWEPLDRGRLERALGPDSHAGEGAYGFGDAFPHDARALSDGRAFLSLPRSVEMELALAEEAIVRLHAGEDDIPDLVTISISATGHAGRAFGAESWEHADLLIRADAAAGALLARLEARSGELGVVITSAHGVAPLPERSVEQGRSAGRLRVDDELPALRAHLREHGGPGADVEAWIPPYIYLSHAGHELVEVAIAWLLERPCVDAALDAHERAWIGDRAAEASTPRDWPGDILVVPQPRCAATEDLPPGRGTSPGSPWPYDREVPLIAAGPGIDHGWRIEEDRRATRAIESLVGIPSSAPEALTRPAQLSARERQVLAYAALGYPNKHIAHALGLAPSTVSTHLRSAMRKVGARSQSALLDIWREAASDDV